MDVFGDVLAAVREAAEPADTATSLPDPTPPKDIVATRLDLAPGALFPTAQV